MSASIHVFVQYGFGCSEMFKLLKVPEHISVEAMEALCLDFARKEERAVWVQWQVIRCEDGTVVDPEDRVAYRIQIPSRCHHCGDFECLHVTGSEQQRRCCSTSAYHVEDLFFSTKMFNNWRLGFEPPVVMGSPPVTDEAVRPHVGGVPERGNDFVDQSGGDAGSLSV